jgi:hypothetical protein
MSSNKTDRKVAEWRTDSFTAFMKFFCISALLVAASGCAPVAGLNTQYSDLRVRQHFAEIQEGDSLMSVYKKIGDPLFISTNAGPYTVKRSATVGFSNVMVLSMNVEQDVSLTYTQPKAPGKSYLLFYLRAQNGRISEKGGPLIMD